MCSLQQGPPGTGCSKRWTATVRAGCGGRRLVIFDPVFEVTDVRLKAEDEVVFAIDSLRVRLDSWRSFAARTPIVSELQLSGIRLTVIVMMRIFGQRPATWGGTFDLNGFGQLPHGQITLVDVDITLAEYMNRCISAPDLMSHG